MTKSRSLTLLIILIIFGCERRKEVEKEFFFDVTKSSKVTFKGRRGEKVDVKLKGTFSGNIKFAMISNSNKLSDKDFSVFKDSINLNVGTLNIYQDSTGFSWYIKPVDATQGQIVMAMTEYRR